jgi:NAD+ synthase
MKYGITLKQANDVIKKIRENILKYFKKNRLNYAVFGASGGLDSSVIAGLLSDIKGVKPIGAVMPCESDAEASRIGELVLDNFNIPKINVDLTKAFHTLMGYYYSMDGINGQLSAILDKNGDNVTLKSLPYRKQRASGNIKARLRMITLYHIAQLTGGIVISTDNLSELMMGFWTINGDVGDFGPIQHIFKGLEEYNIAKALGVPEDALNAVPTDGLDVLPGGTDEDQLGLPYYDLDRVIVSLMRDEFNKKEHCSDIDISEISARIAGQLNYDQEKVKHVAKQLHNTNYKRNWPLTISRKELGLPEIRDIDL